MMQIHLKMELERKQAEMERQKMQAEFEAKMKAMADEINANKND
jgi:hypothetical protein